MPVRISHVMQLKSIYVLYFSLPAERVVANRNFSISPSTYELINLEYVKERFFFNNERLTYVRLKLQIQHLSEIGFRRKDCLFC